MTIAASGAVPLAHAFFPRAHIFMPPMLPPFMPPLEAPTPTTLNSTATGPACSKLSVALTVSPLIERMGEVGEHEVVAAGRKPDRTVRGNVEPARQFAHLHDAVFRLHLVDFDGGEIRRAPGQACRARRLC